MNKRLLKYWWLFLVTGIVLGGALYFKNNAKQPLLSNYSFSSVIYDRNGKLMRLNLSRDDKYRLKTDLKNISEDAKKALLLYEDRWFYYHFGVNPISLLRALAEMVSGGRKQGASTITMQVARQIYHIDSSTFKGKIEQIIRAGWLEFVYSKDEILEAYFNIAPYGGNIEGIGAASLIYFGIDADKLNLQQSLLLTVIPQNPVKRALLDKKGTAMANSAVRRLQQQWIENYPQTDTSFWNLPVQLERNRPFVAPHLIQRLRSETEGKLVLTIDNDYQDMLERVVERFIKDNKIKGIENVAAIIVNYKTHEVLATLGSADFFNSKIKGQVDGTRALRSPGSVLKPFIYALALEQGLIHPLSMLKDVPQNYGLYTPENFDHAFYGLVNATEALISSRNVPAVDLLQKLPDNKFCYLLKEIGVEHLQPADFYGLALALGGAEVSLENVVSLYAMLGNYGEYRKLKYRLEDENEEPKQLISKEAAYLTLRMLEQNKAYDDRELAYQKQKEKYKVYWKTGTSYGFRDAWTAGLAGEYAVAVWVGNFDGTPNNNFVGLTAAAPLFFNIVRALDFVHAHTLEIANRQGLNIKQADICKSTGDLADENCPKVVKGEFIPGVTQIKMSKISRLIPINIKTGLRACRHLPPKTKLERYEFWPSDVEKAFAEAGIRLRRPPDFGENCPPENDYHGKEPHIIFPVAQSTIIWRSKNKTETVPLRAVADADASKLYWFVNNFFVGEAKVGETLPAMLKGGENRIKVVDNLGREQEIVVSVKQID